MLLIGSANSESELSEGENALTQIHAWLLYQEMDIKCMHCYKLSLHIRFPTSLGECPPC